MNKTTFFLVTGIVVLTVFVLSIGYWMGTATQTKYRFENGGQVTCGNRC